MLNGILKNAKKLKSSELKDIVGGAGNGGTPDLSLCGCNCDGTMSGPKYCGQYMGCLQVIRCNDQY